MLPLLQAAHAKGGASRQDLLQLIADICTKSRQLVKNQHTWFRDDDMFAWQDVSSRVRGRAARALACQLPKRTSQCCCRCP
jgi:tRNA A37 N6-isopentenylltransferase MiaA